MSEPEQSKTRWWQDYRTQVLADRSRVTMVEGAWSWLRVVMFLAGIIVLIAVANKMVAVPLCLVAWTGFLIAIRIHSRYLLQRQRYDRLIDVIEESIQRLDGDLSRPRRHRRPAETSLLPENESSAGRTWKLTEQEMDDLDLYHDPVGVFGLVNRCATHFGERCLCDMLENPCLDPRAIVDRQRSVAALETDQRGRMELLAAVDALRYQDDRLEALLETIRNVESPSDSFAIRWFRIVSIPVGAGIVYCGYQSLMGQPGWMAGLVLLLMFNGFVLARYRKLLDRQLRPWRDSYGPIHAWSQAAKDASESSRDWSNEKLDELVRTMSGTDLRTILSRVRSRVGWADVGGMMHLAFNYWILYDLHLADSLLRIVHPQRQRLIDAMRSTAELEAILGLACFADECPAPCCYPHGSEEPGIDIQNMRHPLVAPGEAVFNSLQLHREDRVRIITGSNMSGKSTFLRTTGVNCLLAQVGTKVAAASMRWQPVRIMTDLNARDNLASHESYFLAEVRHVRRLMQAAKDSTPLLGLMDEPFRGTNSTDKAAAGVAVAEHLLQTGHLFLIATHDQQLTAMAGRSDGASNWHFRENLAEGAMVFDYKIRSGPAETRNAIHVLEQERYPQDVLHRMQQLADEIDRHPTHDPPVS